MATGNPVTMQALVVDDDPVSQLVVQHVLVREGWTVVTASSVQAALAVVDALDDPVGIVICDYHMPGGSGLDLLDALLDRSITAPFVLITGVGEQSEVGDDRIGSIAGFLTKPVHSADLIAEVTKALATP